MIFIGLTKKGNAKLAAMEKQVLSLHRELVGHLRKNDQKALIKLLQAARQNLG